jgi:DNA-binding MurR/RpiR family transcriptional regulator
MSAEPREFEALRHRIRELSPNLRRRTAVVAEHILAHADDVAFGTVRGLAKICGVSPTTVFRLVLTLGYSDFRSFRETFREPLRQPTPGSHYGAQAVARTSEASGD